MILLTLGLLVILFSLTLIFTLIHRLINGASINELISTRFYEVFPIRIIFWTLLGIISYWLVVLALAALNNVYSIIFNNADSSGVGKQLLLNGLFAAVFGILFWIVKSCLLKIPEHNHILVKSKGASIRYGITPYLLKELGHERFPNEFSSKNPGERIIRQIISVIGISCLILVIFLLFKNEEYNLNVDFQTPLVKGLFDYPSFQGVVGYFLLLTVPTLISLLLFNNRDYTFISFSNTLKIKAGFLILSILCLKLLKFSTYTVIIAIALIITTYGFRAIADLRLESRYKRIKQVYNPIASKIRQHTPYLEQILDDPHLKLGSLKTELLIKRISQGCKNVEERGVIVTRNFARFLNLVEIQYQEFAVAMLRYLTVRRYITLSSGSGTSRSLQRPSVPMWNLKLFPLNPPIGYVNLVDPLWLPSQWDIVETCGTCGGNGKVSCSNCFGNGRVSESITETYTETDYQGRTQTKTRYRTESKICSSCGGSGRQTCSTCGGAGRLEYTQILNTQWQKLLPLITHPDIPVPELVEDAEEQIIFHLPLTENFTTSTESVEMLHPSTSLAGKMYETGNQLKMLHQVHSQEVETLHNGSLYRADFQIASFRTIMIKFVNLSGRIGWFFGQRPEFYFPRLPLSYTTVLTLTVLPPLWLTLFLLLLGISSAIFPLLT